MDKKRLLAVCDLTRSAWATGEMIHLQELSLMERYEHDLGRIDILWFLDPDDYFITRKSMVTKCNAHYYLTKLLPLAYVNQQLGSFMLMDSMDFALDFIEKNSDRYHVFPDIKFIKARQKFYHKHALKKMCDFYDRNGFVPKLSCSPDMMMWARSFIEKNNLLYPITTQLRKKTYGSKKRNSKIEVWLEFFEFCQKEYRKFKFIVLGTEEEIFPEFRALDNLIFSKDYGTTVEQDFALLASSAMFIGPPSGPMVWAWCCGLPYLIFNFWFVSHSLSYSYKSKRIYLNFATPVQKGIREVENIESVKNEFAALVGKMDFKRWKREFENCKVERWGVEDEFRRRKKATHRRRKEAARRLRSQQDIVVAG